MRAWSQSALSGFEMCPKKFYATRVAKTHNEEMGEAVRWGSDVHRAFEQYFKTGADFPMGMKQFQKIADSFKVPKNTPGVEVLIEQKLAITEALEPCGYFDKGVWVRAVVDYGVIKGPKALIIDWKTGKRKSGDDQLALMAGVMFAQDQKLEQVDSTFVWLQERTPADMVQKITYKRADQAGIWSRFLPRVREFQKAFERDEFPPNPGGLCKRYCPVTSCPYHGT